MSWEFEERLEVEGEMIVRVGDYDYEWAVAEVWRRKTDGRIFMAAGSGCSCYGLFYGIHDWDDMTPLNRSNGAEVFKKALDENHIEALASEVIAAYASVTRALRGQR